MENRLAFKVFCTAAPQGSKKAFAYIPKGGGRPRASIVEDNKRTKPYRQALMQVVMFELQKQGGRRPWAEQHVPVAIWIEYYFNKPPSAKKRIYPVVKPDIDKLTRATLDALTGVLFLDDAQVVKMNVGKNYGSPERVEIVVRQLATEIIKAPYEVKAVKSCG